jgi:hypothetical protein
VINNGISVAIAIPIRIAIDGIPGTADKMPATTATGAATANPVIRAV